MRYARELLEASGRDGLVRNDELGRNVASGRSRVRVLFESRRCVGVVTSSARRGCAWDGVLIRVAMETLRLNYDCCFSGCVLTVSFSDLEVSVGRINSR